MATATWLEEDGKRRKKPAQADSPDSWQIVGQEGSTYVAPDQPGKFWPTRGGVDSVNDEIQMILPVKKEDITYHYVESFDDIRPRDLDKKSL